ncbi:MAG: SRPBCC domain-containing protein [Rhodospirillales bacterium]
MDSIETTELETPRTTLLLTREFNAPRALVFKVWTQPEHVARWWGCAETGEVDFTNDLRVGGEFSVEMRLTNGTVHRIWGVYCKIEEPSLLVFTWAWKGADGFEGSETLVTVSLEETATGTKLTLRHESFSTEDDCQSHGEGWGASLDRLGEFLATV